MKQVTASSKSEGLSRFVLVHPTDGALRDAMGRVRTFPSIEAAYLYRVQNKLGAAMWKPMMRASAGL